ncbi:PREDICTED: uncharacterized protein LOC109358017 [Lupinus angustifolius]|uniref:uncharacterized protein LOC109358017 n=1 Tax=Lupinus angustifolius TaxID=3871 RepID=UPI00092EC23D|nr:PREDICTED: uncharacterized protein LOC109358017 [Lupinus angustifolius]
MVKGCSLSQNGSSSFPDPLLYRQLVGRLLYLTNTRLDISFVVQQLSQFMASPMINHHKTLTRVLRYLRGNPGQCLYYPENSPLHIKAFSDSDWATCPDTHKSISGYCTFLEDSLISWKSKKQTTISRSSSETKYRALALASCEIQWVTFILEDFQLHYTQPALLYYDNNSVRYIATNGVFHERTKHIKIDCHVVRECLQKKLFHLLPISTHD